MRGKYSMDNIWINGQREQDCSISETEITFPGGKLVIQDMLVLREGNLMTTVLSTMPFLKQFIPKTGLPLLEKKLIAKGMLSVNGVAEEGKIIHESVQWK
jgi:hypothetical protein